MADASSNASEPPADSGSSVDGDSTEGDANGGQRERTTSQSERTTSQSDETASPSDGTSSPPDRSESVLERPALRWLAVLSPLAVPWVAVRTTETTLLFPWGFLRPATWRVLTILEYVATTTVPPRLEWWPVAVACYAIALAWTAGRRFGADQRVTAGLFVLVAVCTARIASGFAADPATTAVPVGSIHALVLAAWLYLTARTDR